MSDDLTLDGLEKRLGDNPVTRGVSLSVGQSEVLALLGPSGSGKTTILRLIAGFETPDAGTIRIGGEEITRVPPEKRRFGMVFQHYALFPHMTVGENVGFGLEGRGIAAPERRRQVAEALAAVDLEGFEPRPATELSGGQQQRVALARALAPRPRVLLLDEPLSNLDPALRERTRRELQRLIRRTGITTVFVTHEQEEAFELGDRVALLHLGRLEQVGTPEALYERPSTRFVATFIGRSSVLPAIWRAAGNEALLPGGVAWRAVPGDDLSDGEPVDLVVRPEGVTLGEAPGGGAVAGVVSGRRFAGRSAAFDVSLPSGDSVEVLGRSDAARTGQTVSLRLAQDGPAPRAYRRERA